jgi:hypothetical protein
MRGESNADVFRPLAITVGCIHSDNDWNVEQLLWIPARNRPFNVGFIPARRKWSHAL